MADFDTISKLAKGEDENLELPEDVSPEEFLAAQEKLKLMMENFRAARENNGIQIHYSIYFLAFVVIFGTVGFFAYKLVHSLREKERKREEKKKLKELKKKK